MENRLKQQQNLYEAVRTDRNLYSKNLLEAQDEIQELRMQFRLMSQQINQLKDEISQKDAAKQFEDGERAGHVATNDRHKKNINAIN